MKISRSELRERVRKILVGTLLDEGEKVSDKLLDTVIKYYFLKSEMVTDDEKKFLEESYVDLIGRKEREKIKEEIDIERVKKIVSAFSLSKKSSLLEEFPFEKDLRIFDNVEKIYLFYTKETENKFNEYKKNCKFKEKIEGIEIDGRTVDEIYKKLKELILKNEVNKENTVLDMTLGMKTISIAFYRIAVERQIKAINWNEKFLSSYTQISENEFKENEKGPTPRIALSAKLSLMREPIKESLGIYSRINANIKKGNYEVVSDFYKIIGIDDMAFFYNQLKKIFNIEKMMTMETEEFYENLIEKVEMIVGYKKYESKNIQKLKEVVIYLLNIVYYVTNKEYILKKNIFKITKKDLSENTENFYKEQYLIYLKCKYAELGNKLYYYYTEITDSKNCKEDVYDYIFNKKENNKIIDIKKIYEIIFEEEFKYYDDNDENFKIFEMEKNLLENNDYKLQFKNGILEIPNANFENFVLKIDFSKEKKLRKIVELHNKYGIKEIPMKYKPVLLLLNNLESETNQIDLDDIIEEDANDMTYTRILKVVKDVNEVIAKKLNEKGLKIDVNSFEFIEYEKIRLRGENRRNKFWRKILKIDNGNILSLN